MNAEEKAEDQDSVGRQVSYRMVRSLAHYEIEELGTEEYPFPEGSFRTLEDSQDAALEPLAEILVTMIRSGLDNGDYIVQDGLVEVRKEVELEYP